MKKIDSKRPSWILYLLPAFVIYVFFMAWPLLGSIRLSLYTDSIGGTRTFIGFQNYKQLFTDEQYSVRLFGAYKNTAFFFLIHMLVQNCLGIFLAVLLTNKTMRGAKYYQTIIFLPVTFAVLVTGYLWRLILNPVWNGPLLESIGLNFLIHPWLGDSNTALLFVSLVSCWQWIGIPVILFVSALQGINEDILEAADIEGANAAQVFRRIKLPMIKPVIGIVAILTFVGNFNAFDIVFAMTNVNGAPGYSTDLIGTMFYRVGIAGQHPVGIPNPGLGAAIAAVTFFILCAGVIPALKATQGKDQ